MNRCEIAACVAWDLARIDEIRASGRLTDQQSAQLNGVREHLETYGRIIGKPAASSSMNPFIPGKSA